jgi:hypothetical protein
MAESAHCGNPECGALLDEPPNVPLAERQPCPACGSKLRLYHQELVAQTSSRATMQTLYIAATAAALYAVGQVFVRPPSPEPGYHGKVPPGDVVGGYIWGGLAVGVLAAGTRAVWRRWGGSGFKL